MPESVQSCFELSIHLSVSEPAVNCSKNSSREKNTGKCMEILALWTRGFSRSFATLGFDLQQKKYEK